MCIVDRAPRGITEEELGLVRDLGQMIEHELASLELPTVDELTGLSNRRGFLAVANQTFAHCVRLQIPVSLLLLDLDKFKPTNEQFGHGVGDQPLVRFSECMRAVLRESDVIARLGADEFCVLLIGVPAQSAARPLARPEDELRARNTARRAPYTLEFSAGTIAYNPARHASLNDLLRDADRLVYERKHSKHRNPNRAHDQAGQPRVSSLG